MQCLFQDFAQEGSKHPVPKSKGGGANANPRGGNRILKVGKDNSRRGGGENQSQEGAKASPSTHLK